MRYRSTVTLDVVGNKLSLPFMPVHFCGPATDSRTVRGGCNNSSRTNVKVLINNAAGSICVSLRVVLWRLRVFEPGDGVEALPLVDNLHRVVTERGHEQDGAFAVPSVMIHAAVDAGQRVAERLFTGRRALGLGAISSRPRRGSRRSRPRRR